MFKKSLYVSLFIIITITTNVFGHGSLPDGSMPTVEEMINGRLEPTAKRAREISNKKKLFTEKEQKISNYYTIEIHETSSSRTIKIIITPSVFKND